MQWIEAKEVYARLPRMTAIACIRRALEEERRTTAASAPRVGVDAAELRLLLMPGRVSGVVGLKAITFAERNPQHGLPTIQGLVVLFDSLSGQLIGACDGPSLTAVRTAAIAGYATSQLAAPGAQTMLLAGAGAQAAFQVAAVAAVRPISRVLLWNRTHEKAEGLARRLATWNSEISYQAVADLPAASRQADVITLVTGASEPLLRLEDTKPGCHVNAMGSYHPDRREVASDFVKASMVFADTVAGCAEEAGDLLIPLATGELEWSRVHPLLDANPDFQAERTLLKSVGSSIFDLACAATLFGLLPELSNPSELGNQAEPDWPAETPTRTEHPNPAAG